MKRLSDEEMGDMQRIALTYPNQERAITLSNLIIIELLQRQMEMGK